MEALGSLYFFKSRPEVIMLNNEEDQDAFRSDLKDKVKSLAKRESFNYSYLLTWVIKWRWLCCNFCCLSKSKRFKEKQKMAQGLDLARD